MATGAAAGPAAARDATRDAADDGATELALATLVELRHADAAERHAGLDGRGIRHGPFRGRRRGHGLDFDDLRPYASGDDARHVDWKTSARRGTLHTRLYREERDHALGIALDLRPSMFTGSMTLRAVEAGLLATRLLWRGCSGGARAGVVTFDGRGVAFDRVTGGERGALGGCARIAGAFARARDEAPDTPDRSPDERPSSALGTLLERLLDDERAPDATVIVTGLDDPGTDFDAALARLAAVRPLAVVHVEDPLERDGPPPGRYRYAGADGPTTAHLGRREARALRAILADRLDAMRRRFDLAGVTLLSTRDGAPAVLRALRERGLLP